MHDYFACGGSCRRFLRHKPRTVLQISTTTAWFERGDKVQWILMDRFGFLEMISPKMHQGNRISNYPSHPPCLLLWPAIGKENMPEPLKLDQTAHLNISVDVIASHQDKC